MSSVGCSLRWETFACMMQVFPAGKQCQGSFLQWRQFVLMMDVMAGMVAGENAHGLMILGWLGAYKKKCQFTEFLENSITQQTAMA